VRLLVPLAAAAALAIPAVAAAPSVPVFKHVLVVVFENKEVSAVLGAGDAPTFDALARRYAALDSYDAVTHPSLPNYLALVSGSTQGITKTCTACVIQARSLADTLEANGRSWKTYAEGLPQPGYTGASSGRYAKKHNPFIYFANIAGNPRRRARIVPFTQLRADVRAGRLPSFGLVVPDLCNDMHDCSVSTGDTWLKREIVPLLSSPTLARSVVFIVFDEGSSDTGGGGRIAALALGPVVRPGSHFRTPMNHYGLLRTIEDAWGLPPLGASGAAKPITGIWR
jgi:phosphatidylinositol-3-phosphatase